MIVLDKNKNSIQAVRGMNDILPVSVHHWQRVEKIIQNTVERYGYQEIRFPVLEKTELFKRSIGEVTDIVEKEMYTFTDRSDESVTLRPEGTAGCVRAGIENGSFYHKTQRFWYMGPMFRYERPQKGRYRQFYQLGVEAFGFEGPDIDAELLAMTTRLFRELGLTRLTLQINSLGTVEARNRYRCRLIDFFNQHRADLDEDSLRRLQRNPLRILDSKNPAMQPLLQQAPILQEDLDDESKQNFEQLCRLLDSAQIHYAINPRLVRGLDYYNKTIFEWVTDALGAQGAVCGGGRYDGLVEQLGGHPTPAIGFSIGLERLIELIEIEKQTLPQPQADVYVVSALDLPDETIGVASNLSMTEKLRTAFPKLRVIFHCGGGSLKSQLRHADKSGAQFAIIMGSDEIAEEKVTLKSLRSDNAQERLSLDELVGCLRDFFK